MLSPIYFNIIGTIGLILLLIGFYVEESDKFKSHKVYSLLNLIGSFFLVVYAWQIKGWVFVVLNIFWVFIALYYLIKGK